MRRSARQCLMPVMLLGLFVGGCGGPAASEESQAESKPQDGTSQVSTVVENQEYEAVPNASGASGQDKTDFKPYQAP